MRNIQAPSSPVRHALHLMGATTTTSASGTNGENDNGSTTTKAATTAAQEEAKALMEKVKRMRAEIASLEGKSVEDVELEARQRKEEAAAAQLKDKENSSWKLQQEQSNKEELETSMGSRSNGRQGGGGSFLSVPTTPEEQVIQAANAVERAFRDGKTRQTVRFQLIAFDDTLFDEQQWPGGAQQMYREAAGPLTRQLLMEVRAPTQQQQPRYKNQNETTLSMTTTTADEDEQESQQQQKQKQDANLYAALMKQAPNVTSQDIWDFDGSALITAQAATGPHDDVQALVLPNTDTRYIRDISTIDAAMGPDRLFLLVNPFWRNVESWGFNLLAPKAKAMAKEVIFDDKNGKYEETYVLRKSSVRGEECVALKAYPYKWQLYALLENTGSNYYGASSDAYDIVRLGETDEEPTSSNFTSLLNEREEFRLSKNMRQMQRMMNRDQ